MKKNSEMETLTARIAQLQAEKNDIMAKLGAFQDAFTEARKNGAIDEIKKIHQEGTALDQKLDKVKSEIKALTDQKSNLECGVAKAAQNAVNASKTAISATADITAQKRNFVKIDCKKNSSDVPAQVDSRFAAYAQKILNKLKVQVVPSSECVEVNELFSKMIFSRDDARTQKILDGSKRGFIEKKRSKSKGKVKDRIVNYFSMHNAEGYADQSPLDEFDRAVLGVVISEYLAGNSYTTVNIIFRALIGKVGQVAIVPYKNQKEAIINSVVKLISRIVDFRYFKACFEQMNYTDKNGNDLKFGVEPLLPAGLVDAIVNGQEIEGAVYFKDNSPLFDIADAKNQIVRYPHKLLDVPNQNNTPRIITLKKYVMRRICEIKLHKQLYPTITFADVFKKCRMTNAARDAKLDARNNIIKLFEHLQEKNFIKSFELEKRNGAFYSIKFTYEPKKANT